MRFRALQEMSAAPEREVSLTHGRKFPHGSRNKADQADKARAVALAISSCVLIVLFEGCDLEIRGGARIDMARYR